MNGTAYGYGRVSTEGQAESGLGEQAQRSGVADYFKATLSKQSYKWGGFYFDPATSGNEDMLKREKGAELSRVLKRGDAVIISKVDRAFRNMLDGLTVMKAWHERGIRVVFIDLGGQNFDLGTQMGFAMFSLMLLLAQTEWMRTCERNREKSAAARSQDRVNGRSAPFGFRVAKTRGREQRKLLVPDIAARRMSGWMLAQHEAGNSYKRIADYLLELPADHPNRVNPNTKDQWNYFTVRRWIEQERELREKEKAMKIEGFKDRFLMPSGRTFTLSDFPDSIRETIERELKSE